MGTRYETFLHTWFTQQDYQGHSWKLKPGSAEKMAKRLSGLVYRADDSGYLAALPELMEEVVMVGLEPDAMQLYAEMEKHSLIKSLEVVAPNAAVKAGKLAQIASGGLYRGDDRELIWTDAAQSRLRAVALYVANLAEPVIITYQYQFQLEGLMAAFPGAPVLGVGGVSALTRIWCASTGVKSRCFGAPKKFRHGAEFAAGLPYHDPRIHPCTQPTDTVRSSGVFTGVGRPSPSGACRFLPWKPWRRRSSLR
jgi:hypothetical protein